MAAGPAGPTYTRRRPEETALWRTVQTQLPGFEAIWRDDAEGRELPAFVRGEFAGFLGCGILGWGFGHIRCGDCGASQLVAFSCKARGFCPSCLGRRMCEGAALLVDDEYLRHYPRGAYAGAARAIIAP